MNVDSDVDESVKENAKEGAKESINDAPGASGIVAERRSSTMRIATAKNLLADEDEATTLSPEEQTINKRGCFKSLPTHFCNDMVCGSWYE